MLAQPYQGSKLGAIFYGLVAGFATIVAVVIVSFSAGAFIAWMFDSHGWTGLGEYKPWLPLILGEYSFVPGIIAGFLVCRKIWKARQIV